MSASKKRPPPLAVPAPAPATTSVDGLPTPTGATVSATFRSFFEPGCGTPSTPPTPSTFLTPEECALVQAEEIEVLESIYGDDFSQSGQVVSLRLRSMALASESEFWPTVDQPSVYLTLVLPSEYPIIAPLFELTTKGALSWEDDDALAEALYEQAFASLGEAMVYDLAVAATDALEETLYPEIELRRKFEAAYDVAMRVAERAARERGDSGAPKKFVFDVSRWMAADDEYDLPEVDNRDQIHLTREQAWAHALRVHRLTTKKKHAGMEAAGSSSGSDSLSAKLALQELVGPLVPSAFTGISLRELFDRFELDSNNMSVVGLENVLRFDLAVRFRQYQAELADKYGPKMAEPDVGFHGTSQDVLGSIVRTGLVVPGTKGVTVINGSAYGVGIYVAKNASMSLNYCHANEHIVRMLVCAVLPGIAGTKPLGSVGQTSYDGGHFRVFDAEEAVLPVYIIYFAYRETQGVEHLHVSRGGAVFKVDKAQMRFKTHEDPEATKAAARAASKAASLANASLYFDTTKYIIEDVASVSDDDDDVYCVRPSALKGVLHNDGSFGYIGNAGSYENDRYALSRNSWAAESWLDGNLDTSWLEQDQAGPSS